MFAVVDLGRSPENFGRAPFSNVTFENFVWIEEKADDQIKPGEVTDQVGRQRRPSRKERRQQSGFKGANRISVETLFRKRRDSWRTEDLEMRHRKAITQQFDCRQGQNEIADSAPTDNQNPVH